MSVTGVGITYEYNSTGARRASNEILEMTRRIDQQRAGFDELRRIAGGAMDKIQAGLGAMNRILDEVAQGAASLDIGEAFRNAGAAVPSLERLRAATQGVVDDTTLQRWAVLQSSLGLTAEQVEGLGAQLVYLASRSGNLEQIGRILQQSANGGAEAYRQLGVAIDNSDPRFKGMTETQKKLASAQDLAAEGSKRLGENTDSHAAATARLRTSMANLQSSFQESIAAKAEESGALESLTESVDSLGSALGSMGSGLSTVASVFALIGPVIEVVGKNMELFAMSMYPVTKLLGLTAEGLDFVFDGISDGVGSLVAWGSDLLGFSEGVGEINAAWEKLRNTMEQSKKPAEEHAEALEANIDPAEKVRDKIIEIIAKGEDFKSVLDGKRILEYRDALELMSQELDLAASEFELAATKADELTLRLQEHDRSRVAEHEGIYKQRQAAVERAAQLEAEVEKKRETVSRARYALEGEMAARDNALKDKLGANAEALAKERSDRMISEADAWMAVFDDFDATLATALGYEASTNGYMQMSLAVQQWREAEHEAVYGSMDDWVAHMELVNSSAQAQLEMQKREEDLARKHRGIQQAADKEKLATEKKNNEILAREGEAAASTLLGFALGASWAEHLQGIYSASAKAIEYAFTPGLEWAAVGQIAAIAEHAAAMANAESMGAKKSGGGGASGARASMPTAASVGVSGTSPAGSFGAEEIGNTTSVIMFDGVEVGKAVIRGANESQRYGLTSSMQGRRGWQ